MLEILNQNRANYGTYGELIDTQQQTIVTDRDITADTVDDHFQSILNILSDGIETDYVQNMVLHIKFHDDPVPVDLMIFDYFFNLIFWKLPAAVGDPITTNCLFFDIDTTSKTIKRYCDNIFVKVHRKNMPLKTLCNTLDDCINKFRYINKFAMYLCNTVCLEDTIDLMNSSKEFYDSMHLSLAGKPIEDIKNLGMEAANFQINMIKNSDHCLRDSFKASEGINPKQYKEVSAHIGSKPDGQGGVFPVIIDNSFLNGGVYDPEAALIESSVGRIAQILQKMNVGVSGAFARLLEINNIDTWLNPDPNYTCDTKHFERVTFDSKRKLSMYNMRYYRANPKGVDKVINADTDEFLLGQTVYVRSPMTCASFARGEGICYKCYGDLAYINNDINIGKIAAEILSAIYTQILLSAKHLLESLVIAMQWPEGFLKLFSVNFNTIGINEDYDYTGHTMIIDPESIYLEDEGEDKFEYNEYITSFVIRYPDGSEQAFHTMELDNLYISDELNKLVRTKSKPLNDKIEIDLGDIDDTFTLFLVQIKNNELSRTLDRAKAIINKSDVTKSFDKDTILEAFTNANIEGNIGIDAIHLEILLANQLRDADDEMLKPDWTKIVPKYQVMTLNSALTNNPSVTVSLEYQKIAATFINPLTYQKNAPSFLDLYFHPQPQNYINDERLVSDSYTPQDDREKNIIEPIEWLDVSKKNEPVLEEDESLTGV